MKKKVIFIISIIVTSIIIISSFLIKKVILIVDGNEKVVYTFAGNYEELLERKNIEVTDKIAVSMPLDTPIVNNGELIINSVVIKTEEIIEELPFKENIVKDYKSSTGETRVISEGSNGKIKKVYNVTYHNGVEAGRELVTEEEYVTPVNEVIAEGIFDPNSLTVCVNRQRYLSPNFEPQDLVVPNVRMAASASKNMLRPEAAKALEKMFDAAESEGIYLYAVSGYRSYDYQASIYNPYSGYSAPPGASEHQLGLAMDVNTSYSGTNLTTNFAYTTEGQWVRANAHKFGFVVRYFEGKEDITGYYFEPWHLRYLGVDLATKLTNEEITLEEYYGDY